MEGKGPPFKLFPVLQRLQPVTNSASDPSSSVEVEVDILEKMNIAFRREDAVIARQPSNKLLRFDACR